MRFLFAGAIFLAVLLPAVSALADDLVSHKTATIDGRAVRMVTADLSEWDETTRTVLLWAHAAQG